MKFRKRPVEIEATNFTRETFDSVKDFTNGTAHSFKIEKSINVKCTCIIQTLEVEHIATEGDLIIKGVQGEFYPCKPEIFVKTYEPIN